MPKSVKQAAAEDVFCVSAAYIDWAHSSIDQGGNEPEELRSRALCDLPVNKRKQVEIPHSRRDLIEELRSVAELYIGGSDNDLRAARVFKRATELLRTLPAPAAAAAPAPAQPPKITLPIELKKTSHRFGGTITRVTDFKHVIAKPEDDRSRDFWFFVGDVAWQDGSSSKGIEIAPTQLCYSEDDRSEVDALCRYMSDYLDAHGTWCDSDSSHQGWYANDRGQKQKVRRS